jgi:hypothetical protein
MTNLNTYCKICGAYLGHFRWCRLAVRKKPKPDKPDKK